MIRQQHPGKTESTGSRFLHKPKVWPLIFQLRSVFNVYFSILCSDRLCAEMASLLEKYWGWWSPPECDFYSDMKQIRTEPQSYKSDLFMQKCSWGNNRRQRWTQNSSAQLSSPLYSAGSSSANAALTVIDLLWQHYVLMGFWELRFKSK